MSLLDFYKARFGMAVKPQGNGWNGPCPLCGGEPGKSDRFIVWPDRTESLGQTCAQHGVKGIWSCRQCGASGDTIAYLMKAEGHDFKSALGELGIEGGRRAYHRKRAPAEPRSSSTWQPKAQAMPADAWTTYALKLLEEAESAIWQQEAALRWLASRGIDEQAVRAYRIGYLPAEGTKYPGRWRSRAALGLEARVGEDGRIRDKLFIPRGIIIPTFAQDGRPINLRIRRHQEDLRERSPKYMELEGSCKGPLLLRASGSTQLAAYFVTEAELDAMLIHHVTGGRIGAVAVRTNRGKPDELAHSLLRAAVRVCIALDYDEAGAEGVEFWEKTYPASLRWPTPEGKDPGDAFRLGVDMREWIVAALPPSIALAKSPEPRRGSISQHTVTYQYNLQNGQADTSLPGLLHMGGGGKPQTSVSDEAEGANEMRTSGRLGSVRWASETDFTPEELARLYAALPKGVQLGSVPLDICRAYLLWQPVPITFIRQVDENGIFVGFRWEWDYAWQNKHRETFQAFWAFQRTSRAFDLWISEHPALEVTAKNLFHTWGYGYEG